MPNFPIKDSELILNPDGSVYHLNLRPEHIARDLLFVGDPDRVERITQYFDHIEFSTQKREFKTQTGFLKGKRISVISTGIGTDNIDIVLNELDALVNINLETRRVKDKLTSLNIIRIGTSGALHADLPVDRFLMSRYAIGLDNMLRSYLADEVTEKRLEEDFIKQLSWHADNGRPYATTAGKTLYDQFKSDTLFEGITATASGFYGPQGRVLRLAVQDADLNDKLANFTYGGFRLTNLEMETAAIYGLSKLLGHNALSLNAIIANRATGTFSSDPDAAISRLIDYVLEKMVSS